MKKLMIGILCFCMVFVLTACGQADTKSNDNESSTPETMQTGGTTQDSESEVPEGDSGETVQTENMAKTLVVYFSCTGNTAPLAEYVAEIMGADLYEIIPEEPYTDDDIAYNVDDCRANVEQNDDSCRPAISGEVVDIQDYDVVFIAFPIWWGKEPRIIDTFMESYDFSGKTMIPFCTSGSNGIGTAESNLHSMTDDTVQWLTGRRFAAGTSKEDMEEWLSSLEVLE